MCLYTILLSELYMNTCLFSTLFSASSKPKETFICLVLEISVNITAKTFKSYKEVSTMHLRLSYNTDFSPGINSPRGPFSFHLFQVSWSQRGSLLLLQLNYLALNKVQAMQNTTGTLITRE